MRKFLNNVKTLATDEDGVVSFEYVIVAACVVAAVLFAFGPTGSGAIGSALSTRSPRSSPSFHQLTSRPSNRKGGGIGLPPAFLQACTDALKRLGTGKDGVSQVRDRHGLCVAG